MSKLIYAASKVMQCPRCRRVGKHTLYDYEYAIYKCNNCGNIHA